MATPNEQERSELRALLGKFREDFELYAPRVLRIRPKEPEPGKGIVPLHFNRAQRILLEAVLRQLNTRGYVRAVVLKGRQQGLSTLIQALEYWWVSQRKGMRGIVVAHDKPSATTLFQMSRRYHNHCPEYLRPHTQYSSKTELVFNKLDSSIYVGTAGGDGLGRGDTIQFLHASELAFWPATTAEEVWSGLTDTLPPVKGSFAFAESTAFGNTGKFYELWQQAKTGLNEYEAVFIPWIVQSEYQLKPPEGFERTYLEEEYAEKANKLYADRDWYAPLTDEQLYWRRMKIGEKGAAKFQQEYPLDDDEAFQSTGMSAFAGEHLAYHREKRQEAIASKLLVGDRWENHRNGSLKIFKEIDPGMEYTIGADVGAGISTSRKNADWSVAQVLDENKEQVAVLRLRILPGDFAFQLGKLGELYNDAFIAVENNQHGYHTCQRLYKDYQYANFYREEVLDKITNEMTTRLGFTTSSKTKPLVVNKLRDEIANTVLGKAGIKVNDLTTLDEMRTFVIDTGGKFSADTGYFDDTVMALAIANHAHRGAPEYFDSASYRIDPEKGGADDQHVDIHSYSDLPAVAEGHDSFHLAESQW